MNHSNVVPAVGAEKRNHLSPVGPAEDVGWKRTLHRLLDEGEAAEYLHCSVAFLRRCRLLQKTPRFVRVGRLVRYRLQDLHEFIEGGAAKVAA